MRNTVCCAEAEVYLWLNWRRRCGWREYEACVEMEEKTKFLGKVRGGGTGRGSDRCGLGKDEDL